MLSIQPAPPSPERPAALTTGPAKWKTLKRLKTMGIRSTGLSPAIEPEEENVHQLNITVADLALTMKAVADQARGKGKAVAIDAADPRLLGRRLKAGQIIPWYIIDPTGVLIKEQRSRVSTRIKLEGARAGGERCCGIMSSGQTAWLLVRWPTLFPYWDGITAVALLFTALVTPFEVGFIEPALDPLNGLWLINRVVDLIFVYDMLLQFFTMRKVAVEKAVDANIDWEMDLRVIAKEYLCSIWFLIDVASIAPSALEIYPVFLPSRSQADIDTANGGLRALRTMRSLRLIKLARLAKSSRVITRAVEFVSLSSTTQTGIGLTIQSLLLTHWFACILMISTTFTASPRGTWLFTHGYCTPDGPEGEVYGSGDRGADELGSYSCITEPYLYLKVFFWAMGLIFHNTIPIFVADGPFAPHYLESNTYKKKLTEPEEVLVIVLKLLGIAIWSLTISRLIHAITVLGNPATIAYQQDMDAVNRFCSFNRLPDHLSRELRRYMYNTREVHAQRSRAAIYSKLSPLLVAKVTKLLNRPLFESRLVRRALDGFPPAEGERFVSALVTSSTAAVFSPGDRPPAGRLYLIIEGVAVHKLFQFLSVGDCWGDEDVLLGTAPRKARETKAMTYLRVIWVSRDDFRKLEEDFPEPYGKMRAFAVWKRARRILKAAVQKQKALDKEAERNAREAAANGDDAAGDLLENGSFKNPPSIFALAQAIRDVSPVGQHASADFVPASAPGVPPPVAMGDNGSAATAATATAGGVGMGSAGDAEEVMKAVDLVGGLLMETREELHAKHELLAGEIASVGAVAHASHAALVHISAQLEQLQDAMGLVPPPPVIATENGGGAAPDHARAPKPGGTAGRAATQRGGGRTVAPSASSPTINALRQQNARTRAAFRVMRAEQNGHR